MTATSEVIEPTRTQMSSVVTEQQIDNLPVNGREFIDFALLAPGVQMGDTTSGSTDVIVEPVTKLSFAGQNIHFNFIAVDGADKFRRPREFSAELLRRNRCRNFAWSTRIIRSIRSRYRRNREHHYP